MVFEPSLSTPHELDAYLDPDNPNFGFAIVEWVDSPPFRTPDDTADDARLQNRINHASAFQTHGSPVAWNRYTHLGFYVYDDCNDFESIWRQFVSKQTFCSKMIWFNYKYHVDRDMDTSSKLHSWATEVAKPHLLQLEPSFLQIDTTRTTWKKLLTSTAIQMNPDGTDIRPWHLVGTPKSSGKAKRVPSPLSLPPPVQSPLGTEPSHSNVLGKPSTNTLCSSSAFGSVSWKRPI